MDEHVVKIVIEKAIYGGAGLARDAGKAIFVPFTLPGETVEAEIVADKGGFATAELQTVLEPSPARVQPPCSYFGRCGGCHYQHASYATQMEMKASILRETLERARIAEIPNISTVTGEPFGYRNRIRLHIQKNPFALCYKIRNSHANLSIANCPIAMPLLQRATEVLNREGQSLRLAAFVTEIELFANADESSLLVSLWTGHPGSDAQMYLENLWPRLRQILPEIVGAGIFLSERGRTASRLLAHSGADSLQYPAGNRLYRVSLGSFFQVNRFLLDSLVELVTAGEGGKTAWDLYAGVGLFSRPLTEAFSDVTAVESSGVAVRDLRENLRGKRSRVVAAETSEFLRGALAHHQPVPDLVVVDPPRAGLGREVTSALGNLAPRKITYVSCDPATLSRDLAALLEFGYRLRKMHLLDLFPQTFHLESATHLSLD